MSQLGPIPAHAVDPRTVLSDTEVEAARAAVANAPRLTPRQLDLISAVITPQVRSLFPSRAPAA